MALAVATTIEDSDLVDRARVRDETAIRAIIRKHNRRLYRIARSILRDDAEAEDAVQEAYLNAFRHLGEFRGEAAIGTWLCRIVFNEALGRLRRRRPTVEWQTLEETRPGSAEIIRLRDGGNRPDPEKAMAQRQIRALVERAIDRLPDEFRLVLMARVVEEMSVEETATLLGVKPETVKTRLHRARHYLREALSEQVGPVLSDAFPFEAPRCDRVADRVVLGLAREPRG